MTRSASISRKTGETDVSLTLGLAGTAAGTRSTGVGFFDHMLDLLARHGRLDLTVTVTGDLQTGSHHTVEDTGIVLGQALEALAGAVRPPRDVDRAGRARLVHRDHGVAVAGDPAPVAERGVERLAFGQALDAALGDRSGIARFGHAVVPMDEARAACAIDLSGRPYTYLDGSFEAERVADFETDLAEEFFRAVANSAKLTLHVSVEAGTNPHHMVEVSFKAFARALRQAIAVDPRVQGVPSTKGLL